MWFIHVVYPPVAQCKSAVWSDPACAEDTYDMSGTWSEFTCVEEAQVTTTTTWAWESSYVCAVTAPTVTTTWEWETTYVCENL